MTVKDAHTSGTLTVATTEGNPDGTVLVQLYNADGSIAATKVARSFRGAYRMIDNWTTQRRWIPSKTVPAPAVAPEPQNPFRTAHDALAHMTDHQCRLTLAAILGRLMGGGLHNADADTLLSLCRIAAWDDVVMWAEFNTERAAL